jgi:hypothetical protein
MVSAGAASGSQLRPPSRLRRVPSGVVATSSSGSTGLTAKSRSRSCAAHVSHVLPSALTRSAAPLLS